MGIYILPTISCSTLIYLGTISRPSWSSWYILYNLDTIGTVSRVSYSARVFLVQYLGILDNQGTVSCDYPGTLGISCAILNFEAQYLVDLRHLGLSWYMPYCILCIMAILGPFGSYLTISWVYLGSLGLSCSIMVFKVLYLARRPFNLGNHGISCGIWAIWVQHPGFSRLILNILGYPDYPNPISCIS